MDFDYSEEQRHLRDEARRFLTAHCPSSIVRTAYHNGFDRGLWEQIAAQGWLSVAMPEAHGGMGLGRVELAAIAEEIGAALAPLPFGSTLYLFAEAVMMAGSETQRAAILPQVAQGRLIGCGAIFEGAGDFDVARIEAAVTDGRLTGQKSPVVDGGIADVAVVAARDEAGPGLFLVHLDPTVEREMLEAIDGSANVAALVFHDTPAQRLGTSDARAIERLLEHAAALYAFEQVGGADRCLKMAIVYVKERQAFGGPVGRFQGVKHKLANLYVDNELARSHAFHGIWAVETGDPVLPRAAAAARVAASDAFWGASRETIHLHGAMGFTWDHDAHLHYRRAHHLSLALGSPQWWKDRLFAALAG